MKNHAGSHFKPSYRADIDGLRALAILPVLAFHAFPDWISGGFVGVDVFFVISGYLISLIIIHGLAKGSFSFAEFYSNRVIRIFPALALMMLSVLLVGWFSFLPDEFAPLGKHVAASTLFVENFQLWLEAGYFDVESAKKPLMHLWSLAVEEQFYLIFPLLVWQAWRCSIDTKRLLLALAAASFVLNLFLVHYSDSTLAFFFPLSRFWELMAGGLIAKWHFFLHSAPETEAATLWHRASASLARRIHRHRSGLALTGALLLAIAILSFNEEMLYPGWGATVPVLGATLIILAGQEAWLNKAILSSRPVVYIGKISYPLYLWHWPLLSLPLVITADKLAPLGTCMALALSFILSSLTYHVVEKPFRFGKTRKSSRTALLLGLMLLIGFAGYNIYMRDGLSFRTKNILENNAQYDFRKVPDSYAYQNNCAKRFPDFRGGCMQARDETPTVALLGDSHSLNLFYGLASLSEQDPNLNVVNLRRDSALFLKNVGTAGRKGKQEKEIAETTAIVERAYEIVADTASIKTVILILRGSNYFDPEQKILALSGSPELHDNKQIWQRALQDTLAYLSARGKRIIVLLDWPALSFNPRVCLHTTAEGSTTPCAIPRAVHDKDAAEVQRLAADVLAHYPAVTVFDSAQSFCDTDWCHAAMGKDILYSDSHHLSQKGALHLGARLLPVLKSTEDTSTR